MDVKLLLGLRRVFSPTHAACLGHLHHRDVQIFSALTRLVTGTLFCAAPRFGAHVTQIHEGLFCVRETVVCIAIVWFLFCEVLVACILVSVMHNGGVMDAVDVF